MNKKNIKNIAWILIDKIIRLGGGVFVSVWVAKYLGPKDFGLINYVIAVTTIFFSVASIGSGNIVIKMLVEKKVEQNKILGSAFFMHFLSGFICVVLILLIISKIKSQDGNAFWLAFFIGGALVFKSADVVRYWFEANVVYKYIIAAELIVFLIVSVTRIWLIVIEETAVYFAGVYMLEAALLFIFCFYVYKKNVASFFEWKIDKNVAVDVLKNSWPLMCSGISIAIYMKIDQIMLGEMLGDREVGIYAAAIRLSEVFYILPMAAAASFFPSLVSAKSTNKLLYTNSIKKLLGVMAIMSIIIVASIFFIGDSLICVLYGEEFSLSAQVLVIHVWTSIFVFSGVVAGKWLILENLQKYTLYRTLFGCIISIILNYLLILEYGTIGAAWAVLISQAAANLFFNAINRKTRPIFFMQINAIINPLATIKMVISKQ